MSDLIDRQSVKEWLERWEGYLDKDMIARMQLKVDDIPSHQTPSNTLGALGCVDRQAAIDALDKRFDSVPMEQTTEILMLRKDLRELPSAQPRKGKWIRTRTMTHDGELYCDQCEQEHPEQKIIWNFCPNCGCRMEEGDSDEKD